MKYALWSWPKTSDDRWGSQRQNVHLPVSLITRLPSMPTESSQGPPCGMDIPRHVLGPSGGATESSDLAQDHPCSGSWAWGTRSCPVLESHRLCWESWADLFQREKNHILCRREMHILWIVWITPSCHFLNLLEELNLSFKSPRAPLPLTLDEYSTITSSGY